MNANDIHADKSRQPITTNGQKPGVLRAMPGDGTLAAAWAGEAAMLPGGPGECVPGDSNVLGTDTDMVAGEATGIEPI